MKTITCIICPLGCEITVKSSTSFYGCACRSGEKYAAKELNNPERVITTSVRVKSSIMPLVSVRTTAPVPKKAIPGILKLAAETVISAPVKRNDVIIKAVNGTEADLIATRTLEK